MTEVNLSTEMEMVRYTDITKLVWNVRKRKIKAILITGESNLCQGESIGESEGVDVGAEGGGERREGEGEERRYQVKAVNNCQQNQ